MAGFSIDRHFFLERKFDKRAGRLQYQREYRICEKHIDFLKMYFQIAGITLCENVHLGLIYIQDEMVWEKASASCDYFIYYC